MNYDLTNRQALARTGTVEGRAHLAERPAGTKAKDRNKDKSEE